MKTFNIFLTASALALGTVLTSCTEDIVIGSVDESKYSNVDAITCYVRDARTGKSENVIELRAESYQSSLVFGLNKAPRKGVDVVLQYDEAYAATYNAQHGTQYPLYPESLLSIEDAGKIVVSPDEKLSYEVGLTVTYSDQLEDGQTYLLPVKAVTSTEGITIPDKTSRGVYLVRNFKNETSTDKGPDAVKTFLFFEVNDTNPLNALEFALDNEEETLFFDYVVLFAANINYNAETGRVYVNCNEQVQFLLDHNEEYIQPLRKRGIKVLLGLLGNHDASGLAQLSDLGAQDFARELAVICNTYNLDGVNFDDEYSNSPDLSNPLFTRKSSQAAARLCYETKKVMPDKDVTVFAYGYMYGDHTIEGVEPGRFMDIVVPNYGSRAYPVTGMTLKQCAGYAVELNLSPSRATVSNAQSVVSGGYGYFMLFALYAGDAATSNVTKRQSQANTYCNNVCQGLYGVPLKTVEYYYPQQSLTRVPIGTAL